MKIIAAITVLSTLAISGFSQGQINFQNALTSQLFFNTTANNANKVGAGTIASQPAGDPTSPDVVDVGLYWSTSPFTYPSQGTLADVVTMSTTTPGTIAGGTVILPGTLAGENVYVQVYAWDSTFATPELSLSIGGWFAAWSAGPNNKIFGAIGAAEFVQNLTPSPAPANVIFGTGAGQFGRAVLLEGPEPGTISIGGLGAAALLLFRRRKRTELN